MQHSLWETRCFAIQELPKKKKLKTLVKQIYCYISQWLAEAEQAFLYVKIWK